MLFTHFEDTNILHGSSVDILLWNKVFYFSVCDVLQPLVRETIGVPGPSAKHAAKKLRLDSGNDCPLTGYCK